MQAASPSQHTLVLRGEIGSRYRKRSTRAYRARSEIRLSASQRVSRWRTGAGGLIE
jgi:hypothetical protein